MTRSTIPIRLAPLDFKRLGRLFLASLECEEDRHSYSAYLAHMGRADYGRANTLAQEILRKLSLARVPVLRFRQMRQALALCEKLEINATGSPEAASATWKKFRETEEKCRETNLRFSAYAEKLRFGSYPIPGLLPFELARAREIISRILGHFPDAYWEIIERARPGPGSNASTEDPCETSLPYKLCEKVTITAWARPFWDDYLAKMGSHPDWQEWRQHPLTGVVCTTPVHHVVPGCKIVFVPKTSTEFRTIAVEPSANMMLQLGVHEYVARRFMKPFSNIDLADQTRNQDLALLGSRTGDWATIDLSSASDTVAIQVVKLLLPEQWFGFLDMLRSQSALMSEGTYEQLEKFSTSGNGFTFVLETLIFYALARIVSERRGTDLPVVYGDDIITPTPCYAELVELLTSFGFKVNAKKSFVDGPFRESCGMDAYDGEAVRPVFFRRSNPALVERIDLHNRLYEAGYRDICKYVAGSIPHSLHRYGPPGPPAGFLFTEDESLLSACRIYNKKWQAWTYKAYRLAGVRRGNVLDRDLLEATLAGGGANSDGAPLRMVAKLATHLVARG